MASTIVQYVVVRGDLLTKQVKSNAHFIKIFSKLIAIYIAQAWPIGAVIAQACHAATAAIHLNYQDESTQKYLGDLDNMHKVVLEVVNAHKT